METEKGQPAFENIDDILAEKIIDHTKASADTNAQEKQNVAYDYRKSNRISRLSKPSVLLLLSITFMILLLIKLTSSRR